LLPNQLSCISDQDKVSMAGENNGDENQQPEIPENVQVQII